MRTRSLVLTGLIAVCLLLPAPLSAQGRQDGGYTVALSLSLGGTSDAEPDPGFDDLGLQASFSMETEARVAFGARLGQIALEADEGSAFDADLTYITLSGEYRFAESFYESGLFFGLGFYDLAGDAQVEDESSVGFTLGVTGDFRINERWSVLGEIAGHAVDMDYANFFVTLNAGVAFSF